MKPLLITLTLIASVTGLVITNPHEKHPYTQVLSHKIHAHWCQDPDDEWCEAIAPLSRPTLPLLLYPYTTSQNWRLMTTFHTDLPCVEIHGLGIAGQHLIWPQTEISSSCPLPIVGP